MSSALIKRKKDNSRSSGEYKAQQEGKKKVKSKSEKKKK